MLKSLTQNLRKIYNTMLQIFEYRTLIIEILNQTVSFFKRYNN